MDPTIAATPRTLRQYALIADGERGIVAGPEGELVWMCFPRWDSPALFSSLLGGAGSYAVTPRARHVWGGYYEPPGLIWRNRWICDDRSIVECREALALPAHPMRAIVLRQIVAREGDARVLVSLDLRCDYGRRGAEQLRREDDGSWSAELRGNRVRWTGAEGARVQDGVLQLELDIPAGEQHDLVLVVDAFGDAPPAVDPGTAWEATEARWRERVPTLTASRAPRDASHACAVLRGLTSGSGGMVAAATTSLPERARQGRNYDYRYVWIRDQCYSGQAAAAAGVVDLLDDAVRFVTARLLEHGREMAPAYTTTGSRVPDEHELGLPGYPGGGDVVGNWVNGQFQLDAFGEALLLFAAAAGMDRLDADGWRAVEAAVTAIEERRDEPDAGVWEIDPDHWTHSRLICAAGLRAIAGRQRTTELSGRWLALADALTATAAARSVHPSGRWQRSPDDPRVDAALLVPTLRGAVTPDDPRSVATLRAVERELVQDGYCYRYRPDARPLGDSEGAFLLCGFWLALAYDQQGEHAGAAAWFERNRAACGPPGLLSEEYDVRQRQLRGNLPQAFVHALLLECSATLRD